MGRVEPCSCCGSTDTPLVEGSALCEVCFESLAISEADQRALEGLDRYYGDDGC